MHDWHAACPLAELEPDKPRSLRIDGRQVLLVRTQDDRVHAISAYCTHAHEELTCGMVRQGWIACPAHGARFDLESGEPLNPPARTPIETYAVRQADGRIDVRLPALP